jgi:hypothetical protein
MNCPIWVKWLTCQGQRRLDRRVGRMRGIDSWMRNLWLWNLRLRNLRLWNLRLCQWNREIGMRRRKDRKRQDISNRNKGLRDLWMMHLKRLKRWYIYITLRKILRKVVKLRKDMTSTSTSNRRFRN